VHVLSVAPKVRGVFAGKAHTLRSYRGNRVAANAGLLSGVATQGRTASQTSKGFDCMKE
jgi:hypothetical protein